MEGQRYGTPPPIPRTVPTAASPPALSLSYLSIHLTRHLCSIFPIPQAFLLDYLRNQSVTNRQSPLYGLIGDQSAVMGHSEGGMASLIAGDPALLNNSYSCNFSTIV